MGDGRDGIDTREAIPDDRDHVVALWRSCGLVVAYNDPAADFLSAVNGPASAVLVAEGAAGEIVGAVMVGHDGHPGWLYYLATAPERRGRGVGRALVRAGEDWLRRLGVRKVQLMIRETNLAVGGFYEGLGYADMPRRLMGKWLDPD